MKFDKDMKLYSRYVRFKAKKVLSEEFIKNTIPIVSDATIIEINSNGHPNIESTLITHSEYYFLYFLLIRIFNYIAKKSKK